MRRARKRRGVTLLELMIALAISGLAIVGGMMLLDQLKDSNLRIGLGSAADATAGNGDRLLRRLLVDAQAAFDSTQRFRGDEHNASYVTLCDTPSGWPELCRANLMIDSLRDSSAIIAETDRNDHFEVRRIVGAATFRYLDLSARDSAWVRQWERSITLPTAIAIVAGRDTTVLPLGSTRD